MDKHGYTRIACFLAALLLTQPATHAQGRVWRVAPSGADFTEISTAVAFAQSGDVILVATAPTPYGRFQVYGKSLTIMSADGGKPLVLGETDVGGLPPGGVFRILNLRFRGNDFSSTPTGSGYTLVLDQYSFPNPTVPPVTFVLSGCEVETGRGYWQPSSQRPGVPTAALYPLGNPFVADTLVILDHVRAIGHEQAQGLLAGFVTLIANECFFQGGDAMLRVNLSSYLSHGGPGAWVGDGSFYFADCDMRGGNVPAQVYGDAQNGGNGLTLGANANAFVFARHTTIAGGNSGNVGAGGHGGYGLEMWFTTSQAYVDGQPFVGGMTLAGSIGQVPAVFGTPPPIARRLGAVSFDRALADLGTQANLSLTARPQEPHLLLASVSARQVPIPGILEPLPILGTGAWFPLALVTTDAAGRAMLPLALPPDPWLSAQTLFVQGLGVDLSTLQLIVDSLCSMTLR